MNFEQPTWLNEYSIAINIKLNDLCNTNCLHCVSYGKDKTLFPINSLKHFESLIYFLVENKIKNFHFSFIGGEITLIDINYLKNFFNDFYKIISKISKENNELFFDIFIISNFIIPINKKDPYFKFFKDLLSLKSPLINYAIGTSFDFGLERFKNKNIENLWKNNCDDFVEQLKQPLSLHLTFNSQTCDNIDEILNNKFFLKFENIFLQSLKVFENTDKNIIGSYDTLKNAMNKIRQSPLYKTKIQADYEKFAYYMNINQSNIVSVNFSEYVSLYKNDFHFNLNDFDQFKLDLLKNLLQFKKTRIKQTYNKNCISCDLFQNCDFGLENFYYKCPKFIL